MLETFTETLPRMEVYHRLFSKSCQLRQALTRLYQDLIEFCLSAVKQYLKTYGYFAWHGTDLIEVLGNCSFPA